MDGRTDLTFPHLQLKVRLSGQGQVIRFELNASGTPVSSVRKR